MSVTFQYRLQELKALRQNWNRFYPAWVGRLYQFGLLPLVFFIVTYAASLKVGAVVLLLHTLGGGFIRLYQDRLFSAAIYTESNFARALQQMTITIDPAGLHSLYPDANATFRWTGIDGMTRIKGYLRFQTGPLESFHIPVRAFATEDEATKFLELARKYQGATPPLDTVKVPPL